MLALFAFQCYNLKACSSCRCSSMAEHQLPKLNTRVRFPSPAPACLAMKPNRVSGCSAVGSALGSGPRGRVFKSPHSDHPHGIYGFHGDPFTLDILGRSESALRELGSAEIHGGLPPTIPMESTDSMGTPLHWTSSGGVNPPCGNSAPPRFTADSRRPSPWNLRIPWGPLYIGHPRAE